MTLTELVVATLVLGILAGVSYPTIVNQQNKARQAEALSTLGAISTGQQLYLHENGLFSSSLDGLGLGIEDSTNNYDYSIDLNSPLETSTSATANRDGIESYTEGKVAKEKEGQLILDPPVRCKSVVRRKPRTKPRMQFRNKKASCPSGFKVKD